MRARGRFEETYAFTSFGDFLLTFAEVCKALAEPADYARIAREYAIDAAAQNVRYAEIFISPSVWTYFHPRLDVQGCVQAMREVLDREERRSGLVVRFICDLTRNFGAERALETARTAIALAEAGTGVIAVGLGGDEANFPTASFADPFAFARAHGLRAVAHAGEAAGADSVRDALERLGAERIGHGLRALERADVVRLLQKRGAALECTPTSNFKTGAARADVEHPLFALDRHGIIVTIDADDPALFGTTVTRELEFVAASHGTETAVRFLRNAVEASFAAPEQKAELRGELRAALSSAGCHAIG